jgi:hypothetical protein
MVVLAGGDSILSRAIGSSMEAETESHMWTQSVPVPGLRIINSWQVFQGIRLVLTRAENGHYQIFQSIDQMRSFSLVHDHSSEIYNLFWIDDGRMIFCATDGWWETLDCGLTWSELDLGTAIIARSCAVIGLEDSSWALVAYAEDHKIYYAEYPGGEWAGAFDTTTIWSDKWYPALAGGPAGVLAGAGSYLLRSIEAGEAGWAVISDLPGIIKSIVVSNKSRKPQFLVVVEPDSGSELDKIYLSSDLGDSLVEQVNRIGAIASVQSVVPTGESTIETTFAVVGKRGQDLGHTYKLLTGD